MSEKRKWFLERPVVPRLDDPQLQGYGQRGVVLGLDFPTAPDDVESLVATYVGLTRVKAMFDGSASLVVVCADRRLSELENVGSTPTKQPEHWVSAALTAPIHTTRPSPSGCGWSRTSDNSS